MRGNPFRNLSDTRTVLLYIKRCSISRGKIYPKSPVDLDVDISWCEYTTFAIDNSVRLKGRGGGGRRRREKAIGETTFSLPLFYSAYAQCRLRVALLFYKNITLHLHNHLFLSIQITASVSYEKNAMCLPLFCSCRTTLADQL